MIVDRFPIHTLRELRNAINTLPENELDAIGLELVSGQRLVSMFIRESQLSDGSTVQDAIFLREG